MKSVESKGSKETKEEDTAPSDRDENQCLMDDSLSKIDSLESLFGFGYYHHFQIWIVQTLIALTGAVSYFHMFFMVADPPGWHCQDLSLIHI